VSHPPIRRVLLTASQGSIPGLAGGLVARGLEPHERPLIRFAPPEDWTPLDRALAGIERFRAIAVTSPRAALALVRRLPKKPCPVPAWATGTVTAQLLSGVLTTVHVARGSEAESAAEGVADAILKAGVGSPVLFPCGDLHRQALVLRLETAGGRVESVICYRSVLASPAAGREACAGFDLVVVASPSVARLLADGIPAPERPRLLAAGRTTAAAAEQAGWPADAVAQHPAAEDVLEALSLLQPA
jgi:uroporphyrinogen-III synthase